MCMCKFTPALQTEIIFFVRAPGCDHGPKGSNPLSPAVYGEGARSIQGILKNIFNMSLNAIFMEKSQIEVNKSLDRLSDRKLKKIVINTILSGKESNFNYNAY